MDESKSKMDALLAYANGVTGKTDVSIGDAIKTLCDGYGSGGSIPETLESDIRIILLESDQTAPYEVQMDFIPDLVMIQAIDDVTEPNQFAGFFMQSRSGVNIATGSYINSAYWRVSASGVYGNTNAAMMSVDPNTMVIRIRYVSPYYMVAGARYLFIALKFRKMEE